MNEENKTLPVLDEDTKAAVEYYFSTIYGTEEVDVFADINNNEELSENNNTIRFSFISDSMIYTELVFENLTVKSESDISREDDKYYMTVETLYSEDIYLSFSCVTAEKTKLRDTDPDSLSSAPWSVIFKIASYIRERKPHELSSKEKEVYSLSYFLSIFLSPSLLFRESRNDDIMKDGADLFSSFCSEYGFKDFYKYRLILLSNINPKKKIRALSEMERKLNDIKYKPLFDRIYNALYESQKDYPTTAEFFCDKEELEKKRRKIIKVLRSYGYEGEYPHFYKDGKLSKLRTVQSYGQFYTLTKNSPARFFISITESYIIAEEIPVFDFCCAAHVKRRKEEFTDNILACLFFDKGHRVYDVFMDTEYSDEGEERRIPLDFMAHIAIKKAELIPLSKEESLRINGKVIFPFMLFIVMAVIGSVFFGGLFTPAMMLMTFIIEGEMTIELIWWLKFGVSAGLSFGLLFSLVMAILYKISSTRR